MWKFNENSFFSMENSENAVINFLSIKKILQLSGNIRKLWKKYFIWENWEIDGKFIFFVENFISKRLKNFVSGKTAIKIEN